MEFVLAETGQHRLLLPIPFALAELQASILQFLPTPPLTPGQVELLKHDNLVSATVRLEGRTLEALGIQPASLAAIAPAYLRRFHS